VFGHLNFLPVLDENMAEEVLALTGSEKKEGEFRNYVDSERQSVVEQHYRDMRKSQTVEFVRKMHAKYAFGNADTPPRARMTIREAFRRLDGYVDSSDPDSSLPNIIHSFQTAEGIRKAGKEDWMQLVGLIHDMGKIMYLWGEAEDGQSGTATGPQWALGGDTFVVGCAIPSSCVFPHFNESNPDASDERYNSELGMYSAACGMNNVLMAYGHDEYLYQMLVANKTTIPIEGLYMVRFHSAYPWHTGGAYRSLQSDEDEEMKKSILDFNKFDLYTKDEKGLTMDEVADLWPYYESLIAKYFPCGNSELVW